MAMRVGLDLMATNPGKATKGGLSPEQSGRVRAAILDRLLPLSPYKGNVSALAKALDAQQSSLYRLLYRGAGTSIAVAARVALLLSEDVSDLLGLVRAPRLVEPSDDQPNRPKAIAILKEIGVQPRAIEQLRSLPGPRSDEPMGLVFLVELGLLYNREGARVGTPLPENDDDAAPISRASRSPTPPPQLPPPRRGRARKPRDVG